MWSFYKDDSFSLLICQLKFSIENVSASNMFSMSSGYVLKCISIQIINSGIAASQMLENGWHWTIFCWPSSLNIIKIQFRMYFQIHNKLNLSEWRCRSLVYNDNGRHFPSGLSIEKCLLLHFLQEDKSNLPTAMLSTTIIIITIILSIAEYNLDDTWIIGVRPEVGV